MRPDCSQLARDHIFTAPVITRTHINTQTHSYSFCRRPMRNFTRPGTRPLGDQTARTHERNHTASTSSSSAQSSTTLRTRTFVRHRTRTQPTATATEPQVVNVVTADAEFYLGFRLSFSVSHRRSQFLCGLLAMAQPLSSHGSLRPAHDSRFVAHSSQLAVAPARSRRPRRSFSSCSSPGRDAPRAFGIVSLPCLKPPP